MFAGLILTSVSTLTLRAALFQRKARSGWLEELDGIREDALATPEGSVGEVVDSEDIWTDLRAGGEYADPHEISSLYATDETPDLPAPKAKPTKAPKGRSRKVKDESVAPPSVVDAPLPPVSELPPPPVSELPPPPAPIEVPVSDAPDIDAPVLEAPILEAPVVEEERVAPVAPVAEELPVGTDVGIVLDAEPMWVQPAPHPIRPSEMWHPADLAPPSLGDEVAPAPVEERYTSSQLEGPPVEVEESFAGAAAPAAFEHEDPTYAHLPPSYDEQLVDLEPEEPIDHVRASELESELAAAAHLTVMDDAGLLPIDTPSEGGLVPGPVGRRVRRDRPALPQEQVAYAEPVGEPPVDLPHISRDRGDVSPLPEPPLPPAALPTRAPEPAAEAPFSSVAEVEDPVAAEPIAPDEALAEPEVVEPEVAEPVVLVVGDDGMVAVPGTIVRLDGTPAPVVELADDGAHLSLSTGWAWVSPGDGGPTAVHVELPTALATVTPGSTALTVVEEGDATFVFVADGTVEVRRPDGIAVLTRGSIAMLDPSGAAQVDHASDDELASDPIVAANLALDAEL